MTNLILKKKKKNVEKPLCPVKGKLFPLYTHASWKAEG